MKQVERHYNGNVRLNYITVENVVYLAMCSQYVHCVTRKLSRSVLDMKLCYHVTTWIDLGRSIFTSIFEWFSHSIEYSSKIELTSNRHKASVQNMNTIMSLYARFRRYYCVYRLGAFGDRHKRRLLRHSLCLCILCLFA